MAQSDEEKVQAALSKEVEEPQAPAEAPENAPEPAPSDEPESETEVSEPAEEEDKPQPEASTFTKPPGFEWVKGDTLEQFNENLLEAYKQSTAEALRLRQQVQAPPAAPAAPESAPATPAPAQPQLDPSMASALQYAQAAQQRELTESFNEFAKNYPQAREPQSFDQFEKATQGVSQAFVSANGRVPTYPELFKATADLLGWQPSAKGAQRDAAIKDAAASTATTSPSQPAPKVAKVNPRTLEIMRRIPGNQDKSDADLVKELQPHLT